MKIKNFLHFNYGSIEYFKDDELPNYYFFELKKVDCYGVEMKIPKHHNYVFLHKSGYTYSSEFEVILNEHGFKNEHNDFYAIGCWYSKDFDWEDSLIKV